jgi:hypothetical protein
MKYHVPYNRKYCEDANFFEQTKRERDCNLEFLFYIEEKCMLGFILEMDYFTMAENRKYFWKAFYIVAPMEISGPFEHSNKHFNAATVRA